MKIHVAARNREFAERFKQLHTQFAGVEIHLGVQSLFELLQTIIDGEDDYALFLHDDVLLPSGFADGVEQLIGRLTEEWPNWGLCGNAGIVTPFLAGGTRICRYLSDPHGGPSQGGYVLPAETIDGNCMLLNCRALRLSAVQLPRFSGFQFYDISLSIETLSAGLAVLLAPELALFHNSKGNQKEFDKAAGTSTILDYLSGRLANRFITTLNGQINLPFIGRKFAQFDLCERALANAAKGRAKASVAIVIRSRKLGEDLLQRSVVSALAFAAATDNRQIKTYLIGRIDQMAALGPFASNIEFLPVSNGGNADEMAANLRTAVSQIREDHVLLLDEGNWLFPNDAQTHCNLLACLPTAASLIVDSQNFFEEFTVPGETDWRNSTLRLQHRFNSIDWIANFAGRDLIPNCGAFYSRTVLAEQLTPAFDKMGGCENKALFLLAASHRQSVFFSAPRLVAGISIRSRGDEIAPDMRTDDTLMRRKAEAELAHYVSANQQNNIGFALGHIASQRMRDSGNSGASLSRSDRMVLAVTRMVRGALIFVRSPRLYAAHCKHYVRAFKRHGLRGLARAVADTQTRKQF